MGKFIDLTGLKFGRWFVKERCGCDKHQNILWLCECECGNVKKVLGVSLRNDKTKSCGCLQKDNHHKTHGLTETRLYKIWENMKTRCYNQKSTNYHKYGARGITICDEWLNSFESFRDWALSNGYDDDLTIDRIDNDGNYEPSNCRWVSVKIQSRNTRNNHLITHNGETHCISEWAEILNIPRSTLFYKLKSNNWRF